MLRSIWLRRTCAEPAGGIAAKPDWPERSAFCPNALLRRIRARNRLLGWVGSSQTSEILMQLKLNTRTVNGVTIVDCNGRIVFGEESALLRDALKQLIK